MALRLYRTSMFRPFTAAAGRVVNWNRLLFRYTEPADRERMAGMQAKFSEISLKHAQMPKDLPRIDFNMWRKKIKTPGVVDALEAKYNERMSKMVKSDAGVVASRLASQSSEVAAAEAKAKTSSEFLSELQSEIEWTNEWYQQPEAVAQGSPESFNPFLAKTIHQPQVIWRTNKVLFHSNYFKYEGLAEAKIDDVDLTEVRSQLAKGNVKAMAAVAPILEECGDRSAFQRPFWKKWLSKNPNWPAVLKNPQLSVHYRAFTMRQL